MKELVKVEGDWYSKFIDDCKDILVEHGFASRWALIEGYHAFGNRIIEEMPQLKAVHKTVDKVTSTVGATLGKKVVPGAVISSEEVVDEAEHEGDN